METSGEVSGPSNLLLYTLIVLMTVFWSGNYIAGKFALAEISGPLLAVMRITLAGFLITPLYLTIGHKERHARRPGDFLKLTGLGVLGVTLNQMFFIVGLSLTSVAHASIIVGITPILVLIIAAIVGQERLTLQKITGMLVALCGVGILQMSNGNASGATVVGDFVIFCGALVFAMYTVFSKPVSERLGAMTINFFAYVGGAVLIAPATLWLSHGVHFSGISGRAWLGLLYLSALGSLASYIIYSWALKSVPASRVASFSYLQPVLATLMAIPLLGERLSAPLVAGGAIALAGVALTERG